MIIRASMDINNWTVTADSSQFLSDAEGYVEVKLGRNNVLSRSASLVVVKEG